MIESDCACEIKKFKEMMNFQSETKSTIAQSDFLAQKLTKGKYLFNIL